MAENMCRVCKNLQHEYHYGPKGIEDGIRVDFKIIQPVATWLKSIKNGCTSCQLIWDIITRFGNDIGLNVAQSADQYSEQDNLVLMIRPELPLLVKLAYDVRVRTKFMPSLEVYSTSNSTTSAWPVIPQSEHVIKTLELTRAAQLSRRWLHNCLDNHAACKSKGHGLLPTRVLSLDFSNKDVAVHLHVSKPGQRANYIALSYCWGSATNLKTTSATLSDRKAGVPWNLLPASFKDAILIAKELGIRYLWIDSLCIIQDDKADWEREAGRMGQVYENATMTIATDSATDPMQGIFVPRRTQRDERNLGDTRDVREFRSNDVADFIVDDGKGQDLVVYAREELHHTDFVDMSYSSEYIYPLLSRAWTLQERLLASRTLHFTAYEVIWECRTTLACECGSVLRGFPDERFCGPKISFDKALASTIKNDRAKSKGLGGKPRSKDFLYAWTAIIDRYSHRRLTHLSDRLPALSGIAARFASVDTNAEEDTYLAGLWREDLPWLLCWATQRDRCAERPTEYWAPTWSWASVKTPVRWNDEFTTVSKITILESSVTSDGLGHNKYGSVKTGFIVLQGLVQVAKLEFVDQYQDTLRLVNDWDEEMYFTPDHDSPVSTAQHGVSNTQGPSTANAVPIPRQRTAHSLRDGDKVYCLFVTHNEDEDDVYGLVLAPAICAASGNTHPLSQSIGSKYQQNLPPLERIGIIDKWATTYTGDHESDTSWFAGATMEIVTII